jgi:hypothetical protein
VAPFGQEYLASFHQEYSYDKVKSILRGRFSGVLYGTIVAEYIGPITDSITVNNGEFCIALNK